jgi:hypothetical protein
MFQATLPIVPPCSSTKLALQGVQKYACIIEVLTFGDRTATGVGPARSVADSDGEKEMGGEGVEWVGKGVGEEAHCLAGRLLWAWDLQVIPLLLRPRRKAVNLGGLTVAV